MVKTAFDGPRHIPLTRRNVALGACALGVILLCILSAILLPKLNQPVEGKVQTLNAKTAAANTAPHVLATPYYTTEFPQSFREMAQPAHSASLDARMLVGRAAGNYGTSSHIALTVVKQQPGGVTADSSYLLYKNHPETYTLSSQSIDGEDITVATLTDSGYEKIYLWPHGSLLLNIDMTTGSQSAVADADIATLIQHLHWNTNQ